MRRREKERYNKRPLWSAHFCNCTSQLMSQISETRAAHDWTHTLTTVATNDGQIFTQFSGQRLYSPTHSVFRHTHTHIFDPWFLQLPNIFVSLAYTHTHTHNMVKRGRLLLLKRLVCRMMNRIISRQRVLTTKWIQIWQRSLSRSGETLWADGPLSVALVKWVSGW